MNTPSSHADSFTPQELAAWRGLREVHARVIHQLDGQMQAVHGPTLSQCEVLILLYDAPGQRMRMTEIADAVLLSRSACTRLVDRLETLGYVTRRAAFLNRLRATDLVALGDIWARIRAGAFPSIGRTGRTEPHRLPIPARA